MVQRSVCMFVRNPFTNDARVLRESTALVEAGYEVDVIATCDWKNPQLPKQQVISEGLTVYRVEGGTWWYMMTFLGICLIIIGFFSFPAALITTGFVLLLLMIRQVRSLIHYSWITFQMIIKGIEKDYDIYHANDLDTLPQGVLCAKIFKQKQLVYDSHEIQTSRTGYFHAFYGILEKFLLGFIDEYIHENHTRAKYIEGRYGIYPKVIHNYPVFMTGDRQVDFWLHQELSIPQTEPILLYQGGLQPGRGLEKIIEATSLFKGGVVVFIGDGLLKLKLMKMVQERKLEQQVKFIPKVPLMDLANYTKQAYLGFQVLNNTCFNHYSASSNKLFEYMMSGVPVIACDFPEIKRVVEKEQVGVCVDSHSPVAIAAAVNDLLEHPEERERMSRNCLQAREIYSWEKEKEIFLEIYARLSHSIYLLKG